MAFQIKQIHFLVSKKAAARKQKRYDTGYALTANGATQRPNRRLLTTVYRCSLTAIRTANIHPLRRISHM